MLHKFADSFAAILFNISCNNNNNNNAEFFGNINIDNLYN